jgi:transposase
LEHDTAGDPITGLKWTRKTPQKIAELLEQVDIPVSANTVARLLHNMNFSLRANRKNLASGASPNISPHCAIASSVTAFR